MRQTKPPWRPHPPASPDWPSHVKQIYEAGCRRIDELRKQMEPDGVCPIPFRCYGCDGVRDDFALLTGDGCPMCEGCVGRCTDAMERVTA